MDSTELIYYFPNCLERNSLNLIHVYFIQILYNIRYIVYHWVFNISSYEKRNSKFNVMYPLNPFETIETIRPNVISVIILALNKKNIDSFVFLQYWRNIPYIKNITYNNIQIYMHIYNNLIIIEVYDFNVNKLTRQYIQK